MTVMRSLKYYNKFREVAVAVEQRYNFGRNLQSVWISLEDGSILFSRGIEWLISREYLTMEGTEYQDIVRLRVTGLYGIRAISAYCATLLGLHRLF